MTLVLWCTGIRCQQKSSINVALVRPFSAIKDKDCLRALGLTILKKCLKMSMYILRYISKKIKNFKVVLFSGLLYKLRSF